MIYIKRARGQVRVRVRLLINVVNAMVRGAMRTRHTMRCNAEGLSPADVPTRVSTKFRPATGGAYRVAYADANRRISCGRCFTIALRQIAPRDRSSRSGSGSEK